MISAEDIPETDRLLRLKVDIGLDVREIISGTKGSYLPEELVGKIVIIVANLKPKKMRFGVSNGMMIIATFPEYEDIYGRFIGADFHEALEAMNL